jgi:hypothetical protein
MTQRDFNVKNGWLPGVAISVGSRWIDPKLETHMNNSLNKVTVELDSKWARLARSPIYFVVAALQGVSVTFAPLFLYWSGQGKFFPGSERIVVPVCFAVIFLVPTFYFLLGTAVVRELRRK